jgi:branched-chain amino acid aminotransferase
MNEHFFVYNNKFFVSGTPVISAGSRALKYGDGIFETMRMLDGRILNEDFHFERLFKGLTLLQFTIPKLFSRGFLIQKINELLKKNGHLKNARIRLMVFRGNDELFSSADSNPEYIIETWPLPDTIELNPNGLIVNVFSDARKSCDEFSNLKSNNYLPFAMAAIYAKKNKLNDAIILNAFNRVCETAVANIFIIKDDKIFTPPLSEGCVAGTMRRWLLEGKIAKKYAFEEKPLSLEDLYLAEEVFLTNAIHPIRWVKFFRDTPYTNEKVREIFEFVVQNV